MKSYDLEDEDEVSSKLQKPMKTCLVLSASFTFVYTAYLAIQNLQSSLNDEANLGVTSLCVLYGTIILFGPQAPLAMRLIGPKRVLALAWIIHCVYTASNFYPTWGTLVPSSALLGAIAGPMWTAQGIYITAAGEKHAAMTAARLHPEAYEKFTHVVLSRFNGIFFMFYELTQITGNLVSSLVLSESSYNSTQSSQDDIAVCGPNDCPSSGTSSNSTTSSIAKPEASVIYIMLSIFLGCNVCGLILTLFLLPNQPDNWSRKRSDSTPNQISSSAMEDLSQCFRMVLDGRMILLMPLFAAQAMAIGILYADYTKAYISCVIGIRWVGFVMTSYGLCTAVFAISINSFASRLGRRVLFVVAIVVDTGSLVAMLIWQPLGSESVAVYFLIPAVSGISEGIMQAQFNTLIGQVFAEKRSPAFAAYHTSKAVSFTLTFALSNFVCLRKRLYLSIALYTLGLLGYLVTEARLRRASVQSRNKKAAATEILSREVKIPD
ncbi:Unc-93-like protein A [Elysia marginata]|uniref:Unc-93-like protein A n=1 Tax=Elysia marginata TaxID=1093978 RepID=A0AAV4IS67_9GAST|nr:Unc-93-like protein A [Elysia marginata]